MTNHNCIQEEKIGRIDERVLSISASLCRIEKCLVGNGTPGLRREMDEAQRNILENKTGIRNIEQKIDRLRRHVLITGVVMSCLILSQLTVSQVNILWKLIDKMF